MATQEAVIATAAEMFAVEGYAGTSMREIARAVGIKPASIYNHFASKEDILWVIAETALVEAEAAQEVAAHGLEAPSEQLRAFVRTHVRYHGEHRYYARVIGAQLRTLSRERYEAVTQFRDRYEHRLRATLAAGNKAKEFNVPDVQLATYSILGMGKIAEWYNPSGPLTLEYICDHYEQMAARMTECALALDS